MQLGFASSHSFEGSETWRQGWRCSEPLIGILTSLKFDPRRVCIELYYCSRPDLDACVAFGCYISISAGLDMDQQGIHMRQLVWEMRVPPDQLVVRSSTRFSLGLAVQLA